MEKLYNKTTKPIEFLEVVFTIMFMVVGFLQCSCLTFGKPIISIVQWPTIFFGGLLVLYRLLFLKKFIRVKSIFLLVGFIASFILSMVVNIKYGFYENFKGLIFIVFQIGVVYAFDTEKSAEKLIKKFNVVALFYLGFICLLSVISIVFLLKGVSEIYPQEVGPTIVVGFAWGRLFGAYWDPNIAAAMNAIAVAISVYFIMRFKNIFFRILMIFGIIVNVVYIAFSDSRTGIVTLCISSIVFFAFYLFNKGFKGLKCNGLRIVACVVAVVVIAGLTLKLPGAIKDGYNAYTTAKYNQVLEDSVPEESVNENIENSVVNEQTEAVQPALAEDNQQAPPTISSDGREEDISNDISNRRFDIWKSAVEIFKTTPIVGTSHFNIVPYAQEIMPDAYILTNDHMVFYTMHNFFVDVLVSQGLLGIATIVGAALWMVVFLLKKFKLFNNGKSATLNFVALSVVLTVIASSLFMTEIVYVITPLTLMFWLSLGVLMNNLQKEDI